MHALIIETDALIAMTIEDALQDLGFTSFDYASTGQEALSAAQVRCPDLITADVRLHIGCGIETIQDICSGKPIPVIFITTEAGEVARRAPGLPVVRKPFAIDELNAAVGEAGLS